MIRRAVFSMLLLLSIVLISCDGDESEPEPSNAVFTFEVEEGVEDGDRMVIEKVLRDVRAYFVEETGSDIQRDVTVRIKTGDPLTGKAAYGGYKFIEFYLGVPGYTFWRNRRAEANNAALIAHEYFHTLQWDLIGGEGEPNWPTTFPPAWLLEGSAELAAYKFTEQAGYVTTQNAIDYYRGFIAGTPQPRLGTVIVNSQANYAQAFLAVERLGREYDLRTFATFFQDAGTMEWRAAFEKNFGESVDAFIDRYEAQSGARTP